MESVAAAGWALGDGPSSYNRRRRMMAGDSLVASEGRLENNPLLKGAGEKGRKVQAAAALFDLSSLW